MEERADAQAMFLDVAPNVLDRFFRSGIVKEVSFQEKPFHPNEREMLMFKD